MSLLDKAAQMSSELTPLWGKAIGDRKEYSETKKIRDQAYTHLKEAVDEVRECGQYLFWHNAERLKGYKFTYGQGQRSKNKEDQKKVETTAAKTSEESSKAAEEKKS